MSARVVIVNGLPGVGKTTQAQALATGLGWPMLTKDMFKESLFDSLGWSDRAWSRKLSKASMDLLFVWLESELRAGRDCVIEANFESESDTPRFVALADRYAVCWVQILVVCDGETLWQRHINRGNDGSRHPGHQEAAVALELRERLLTGRVAPLTLAAPCIELDTTDLTKIDVATVLQRVRDSF